MEILVIQTAFPGDLFLSIPLLRQAKEIYPGAHISLLCRKGLGEAFLKFKIVERVFEIEKGNARSYDLALEKLREVEFDLVVSPHRSFRTALLVRKLKAKKTISFKRWWNRPFFSERIPFPKHLPDALRQLSLIKKDIPQSLAGLTGVKSQNLLSFEQGSIPSWASMKVIPSGEKENIIYLAPGSVWATKKWKVESFQELAVRLLGEGFTVALTGSGADAKDCAQVAQVDARIQNLCGKTNLSEVLDRFGKAKALVANDSGAIHMAASVGLPTVAIFGPTVPEFGFRPWNESAVVVQDPVLKCRPCSIHGTKVCPLGTHVCMKNVGVDQVLTALRSTLSR